MKSPRARIWLPLLLIAVLGGLWPTPAAAHPLGNFTVNLYSRLEVGGPAVDLLYVVDMAEIPTFQELAAQPDRLATPAAQARYLAERAPALRDGLRLSADGRPLELAIVEQGLALLPGQGQLPTLRIELRLRAVLPSEGQFDLAFVDTNYADRLGWHEVVLRPLGDATVVASSAPASDRSDALRAYPADLLASPPDVRAATATVRPGSAVASRAEVASTSPVERAADPLAALVAGEPLTGMALLLACVVAAGLGALHALGPGHGKAIVGAYLVGAYGTPRHAALLGLTVTITHTLGVFGLGLVTLFAARFVLPEQIFPWLALASGLLVVGLGLGLLRQRMRGAGHTHVAGDPAGHGPGGHAHALPAGALSGRSLLALGISGGLLPCPSALVLMLAAIALGRIPLGLLLIVCFSLGLASVLTAVGLLFVLGRGWLGRIRASGRAAGVGAIVRMAPVASACAITVAGLLMTARAIGQL